MLFGEFGRRERVKIYKEIYKEYSPVKRLGRLLSKIFTGKTDDVSPVLRVLKFATLLYHSKVKNKTKN